MTTKEKPKPTKYHVLRRSGPATLAVIATEVEAHSGVQAMKAAAAEGLISQEDLDVGVRLVAVPVSNWTEEPVGVYTPPARLVVGIPGQITVEEVLSEVDADADADGSED